MPLTVAGKIGFIGGGNMAEAFINGLVTGGCSPGDILFSEPHQGRRLQIESRYRICSAIDNESLVSACKIIVLAVKPQVLQDVLPGIAAAFSEDKLLISILAGVTIETLEAGLNGSPRVIRSMPNTPALAGCGASALCAGKYVQAQDRLIAQQLFESVGKALWVGEVDIDAVTGLSGSGPAYVYSFIEALAAGGVAEGLSEDTALALAVQTVVGAATLVERTGENPAALREKVCSPGGTTIQGVQALEDQGFHKVVMAAVGAATRRSRELGQK